jgi:hypothetical protein
VAAAASGKRRGDGGAGFTPLRGHEAVALAQEGPEGSRTAWG